MNWELDHVFVATSAAGSAEVSLAEFGIAFTERRVHRGQGTANACAIFENAFLELLCAHDLDELRSDIVRPLGLEERIRWRETGACPFGVCFRPTDVTRDPQSWPFRTWPYRPPYIPTGASIPIVTPAECLTEPLLFVSTWMGPGTGSSSPGSPFHHGARRTLTRVAVDCTTRASPLSEGAHWFVKSGFLSLRESSQYLIDLEWDGAREGQSKDFSATVPIRVRW